jgi:predicted RNA-binding protein (TIGR00451 family)
LFSLSIEGARKLMRNREPGECFVTVKSEVKKFIAEGGDVFAAHVVAADDVRAKDEIVVLDEERGILAVGRAVLSGSEMLVFKRGVAVKVRRGVNEES